MDAQKLSHDEASKLSSDYFSRIIDLYGEESHKSAPTGPRTVALVLHSQAYIDNGGFFHLFEVGLVDDLGYGAVHRAYVAIGAKKTAALIRKATENFPEYPEDFGADYDIRRLYWGSASEAEWDRRDDCFYALTARDMEEDIDVLVARYILRNPQLFDHLPPARADGDKS